MDKVTKVALAFGALVAIVLIGIGIGWFASRGPDTGIVPSPVAERTPDSAAPVSPPDSTGPPLPRTATNRVVRTTPLPGSERTEVVIPEPEPETWEDKLDDILASDMDDTNKVAQMFAMFPTLNNEGKEEVVQHLSNLVEDEQYAPLGQLFLDPRQPTDVLDLLMADVLNRPNTIKLPMFLGVARTPNHPNREEALELLELFLDEEYGENWTAWQTKMEEWLKENPE